MTKARAFFYVCAGVFLLALSYHLGASSVEAQAPGNPVAAINGTIAVTANGDVYEVNGQSNFATASWHRCPNIFTGSTSATQETWGQLKTRYR